MLRMALILTLLVFSGTSLAQHNQNKQQKESVPSTNNSKKIFSLINKANNKVNSDPNEAGEIIQKALRMSIESDDSRAEAYCYNTLGAINFQLTNYVISANYYGKSIKIFAEVGDEKGRYNSLKHVGRAYHKAGTIMKAEEYYLIFLELARKKGNEDDEAEVLTNLGQLAYSQGEYNKAKSYFNMASRIEKRQKDERGIANTKNWLGKVEEAMGNDEVALQQYISANGIYQMNSDTAMINATYDNIGNVYNNSSRNMDAIDIQQEALEYNTIVGNRKGQLMNAQNIARYNLDANNPTDAIPFIQNSIDISNELGDLEAFTDGTRLMSEALEQQGDYEGALSEYQVYLSLVDSVEQANEEEAKKELEILKTSARLNKQVSELENLRYELSASSARILTLEEDVAKSHERAELAETQKKLMAKKAAVDAERRKNNEIIMWALAGLLLVVLVSSSLIYKNAREKRIANQLLALKSLRSQMNPHFIFNSLNSVNSFIAKNDERSANKYLSEFSKLMRSVMENSKHDLVPMSSELEILKLYLDLEHLRFKDKFDFTFDVDPNLDMDGVEIPPMLIQPYIENSIWHGLRYKEEKGHLSVQFKQYEERIVCVIEDNGIGRKKSQEMKTHNQKQNKSTGMKNIEGRLTILNKLHNTSLGVEVTDLVENGEPQGTRVEVSIPYNVNQEAA